MNKFKLRRALVAVALLLIIALSVAYVQRAQLRTFYDGVMGRDYVGDGTGSVTMVIKSGETGVDVAADLESLGVVKNADIVYRLIAAENTVFFPGTYTLHKKMSSSAALALLTDTKSHVVNKVTIKEGLRIATVLQQLSDATGIPVQSFVQAAQDHAAVGVPAGLYNIDGYLFPATYDFDPSMTATQILKTMVDRTYQELDSFGVPKADRHRVLTFASIVQKEARQTQDFYKVSRVFANRLKIGMKLQSDATVSYGSGGTTVTTTDAERAANSGYNTYVRDGLPIGPIGGAGHLAIDATLHPADGTWLYFCAINLATGETVFSTTQAQHSAAVLKFQAWIRANPGWNGN
jgi:UPF0755 protein